MLHTQRGLHTQTHTHTHIYWTYIIFMYCDYLFMFMCLPWSDQQPRGLPSYILQVYLSYSHSLSPFLSISLSVIILWLCLSIDFICILWRRQNNSESLRNYVMYVCVPVCRSHFGTLINRAWVVLTEPLRFPPSPSLPLSFPRSACWFFDWKDYFFGWNSLIVLDVASDQATLICCI